MASSSYNDIPRQVRDLLDEVYLPEGAVIWWNNAHKLLGGESARERWEREPDDVLALIDILLTGAFV